MMTNFMGFSS